MITENNFITKLEGRNIDIYGLPQWKNRRDDNYDYDASIQIDWELYFEMRTWGLKSISAYATNVNVEILVNWWNDDDTPEMETIEIGTQGEWVIENDTDNLEFGDCIEPQEVVVDFGTKTITIQF